MTSPELSPDEAELAAELRATLNAYDAAPNDVQEEMIAALRGKDPGYIVPTELMETGYAISALETNSPHLDHAEAVQQALMLRQASEGNPAIGGLLRLLAQQSRKPFGKKED